MGDLDRAVEAAAEALRATGWAQWESEAARLAVEAAAPCFESWDWLVHILDQHYPPDVFVGGVGSDEGPRIVGLIRRAAHAEADLEATRTHAEDTWERMERAETEMRQEQKEKQLAEVRVAELKAEVEEALQALRDAGKAVDRWWQFRHCHRTIENLRAEVERLQDFAKRSEGMVLDERALADRLAEACRHIIGDSMINEALAAWEEARR